MTHPHTARHGSLFEVWRPLDWEHLSTEAQKAYSQAATNIQRLSKEEAPINLVHPDDVGVQLLGPQDLRQCIEGSPLRRVFLPEIKEKVDQSLPPCRYYRRQGNVIKLTAGNAPYSRGESGHAGVLLDEPTIKAEAMIALDAALHAVGSWERPWGSANLVRIASSLGALVQTKYHLSGIYSQTELIEAMAPFQNVSLPFLPIAIRALQ